MLPTFMELDNMENNNRENNRENIVFFFGAGASATDNAPLTSQLLSEALKLDRQNSIIDKRVENVRNFLKKVYCHNDINQIYPTFEEVLSPIDIAIQRDEGLSKDFDLYDLKKLRIDLIYCICKVLREKLWREAVNHDRFVNNLFNDRTKENNYAFLSSNYDLLLDNALHYNSQREIYVDYGFKFMNEKDIANNAGSPPILKVPLLKLHGSLNWKYYPYGTSKKKQGEGIEICEGKADFDYPAFDPYSNSSNSQYAARPLIIPPTYIKNYDNRYLEKVWERASKELENASKIFFVGYSMPDADIHIKHLMLRSFSRNKNRNENRLKIFVVGRKRNNNDSQYCIQNIFCMECDCRKRNNTHSQPYDNYKRIYGEIISLPIGFEGFIENLNEYI